MKIVLTTPFNPGDLDPGKTYPHVFIPRFMDANQGTNLSFDYEYGTAVVSSVTVAGIGLLGTSGSANVTTWTKGSGSPTKTVVIASTAYLQLVNESPLITTDSCYNVMMRVMYTYLLNTVGIAGTLSNP